MARIFLKSAFVGAALAASLSSAALAHGPTRQKVVEKVEIKASPDKVWAVIGNFQDMSWHPAIKATTGEGGNEPGAKRKLDLGGGAVISEELTKHDDAGRTYSYRITDVDLKVLPVNNYSSTIEVKPSADGAGSEVAWHGAFYRGFPNNDPPPELNEEAAIKAVTGVYKAGLQALKTKLDATN